MKQKHLIQLIVCAVIVFLGTVVLLRPARAGVGESKGVTIVFEGGGVMFMPECRISDFNKTQLGKGDRDIGSWSECGGGTESLSRINATNVVAICAGNCR